MVRPTDLHNNNDHCGGSACCCWENYWASARGLKLPLGFSCGVVATRDVRGGSDPSVGWAPVIRRWRSSSALD